MDQSVLIVGGGYAGPLDPHNPPATFLKNVCDMLNAMGIGCQEHDQSMNIDCQEHDQSMNIDCQEHDQSMNIDCQEHQSMNIDCQEHQSMNIDCQEHQSMNIDCREHDQSMNMTSPVDNSESIRFYWTREFDITEMNKYQTVIVVGDQLPSEKAGGLWGAACPPAGGLWGACCPPAGGLWGLRSIKACPPFETLVADGQDVFLVNYRQPVELFRIISELTGVDPYYVASHYQPVHDPLVLTIYTDRQFKFPPIFSRFVKIARHGAVKSRSPLSIVMKKQHTPLPFNKLTHDLQQIFTQGETNTSYGHFSTSFRIHQCINVENVVEKLPKSSIFNCISSFLECINPKCRFGYVTVLYGDREVLSLLRNAVTTLLIIGVKPLVVAYDRDTVAGLEDLEIAIIKMGDASRNPPFPQNPLLFKKWQSNQTMDRLSMWFQKFYITKSLLDAGLTVVYSDADVVFIRNSIPDLVSFLLSSRYDMLIQSTPQNNYCTGFYVVRPNEVTKRQMSVPSEIWGYFKGGDQHYFNNVIAHELSIFRLPPWDYPVGRIFTRLGDRLDPVLVHFNGFDSNLDKIKFGTNRGYHLIYHLKKYTYVFLFEKASNFRFFSDFYKCLVKLGLSVSFYLKNTRQQPILVTDNAKYIKLGLPTIGGGGTESPLDPPAVGGIASSPHSPPAGGKAVPEGSAPRAQPEALQDLALHNASRTMSPYNPPNLFIYDGKNWFKLLALLSRSLP